MYIWICKITLSIIIASSFVARPRHPRPGRQPESKTTGWINWMIIVIKKAELKYMYKCLWRIIWISCCFYCQESSWCLCQFQVPDPDCFAALGDHAWRQPGCHCTTQPAWQRKCKLGWMGLANMAEVMENNHIVTYKKKNYFLHIGDRWWFPNMGVPPHHPY